METEKLQVSAQTLAERMILDKIVAGKPKRKTMPEASEDHAGLPVKGYQPQSEMKVQAVNHNKELEEVILRVCDSLKLTVGVDPRWLAIGRTHIEEGFMAINRSIFKPSRVQLASDGPGPELDLTAKQRVEQSIFDALKHDDKGELQSNENVPDVAKRDDIVA